MTTAQLDAQRKRARRAGDSKPTSQNLAPDKIGELHEPTATEITLARRAVDRAVKDVTARGELLAMLGLTTPENTTQRPRHPNGRPRRSRALCPVCDRTQYLKQDGTLSHHDGRDGDRCNGSQMIAGGEAE